MTINRVESLGSTAYRLSTRWGGFAAILAGILGIFLTPFMASIWAYEGGAVVWEETMVLVRYFGPALEQAGFLSFAPEHVVYYTYGRLYFLVYLLLLPGVVAFHAALPQRVQEYGNLRERHRLLMLALLIAMLGDIGGYWGGSGDEFGGVQAAGAFVEIAGLVMIFGASLIYGLGLRKAGLDPRWVAWLLIFSGPAAILFNCSVVFYFPNGPMLFFCMSWVVLGFWSLRETRRVSGAAAIG